MLSFDLAALLGREHELPSLVHAWCARLADEGVDDLLVTVAPDADLRSYFVDERRSTRRQRASAVVSGSPAGETISPVT